MTDLMGVLQLLGAGSAGAVVAQYVSAAPERRQARAAARTAMTALEEAIWSQGDPQEWSRLRRAVHAFESAAMIAGVPREISEWYVTTRVAFFKESRRSFERHPDPEYGGGVDGRHFRGLNTATEIVYRALWHPQRSRLFWRPHLKRARADALTATEDSPDLLRNLNERRSI
ncbi:hypothetical protein AB0N17_25995 [Streptomyces sp. NPDC051133]|uniref:hypothetical protein n=1 Tax=Streptomyces sp. NPDC051133 TaxID=3155521 RepID=UPI003448220D